MRHLWTVVCLRAVLDRYTNRLSLLEVLDELMVLAGQKLPDSLEAKTALPLHLEVVVQWERSAIENPERGECQVELFTPTGERAGAGELDVDLQAAPRSRLILRFDKLPLAGLGRYRFVVSKKEDGQTDWELVDEIPLYVKLEETESPSTAVTSQPKKKKALKRK